MCSVRVILELDKIKAVGKLPPGEGHSFCH